MEEEYQAKMRLASGVRIALACMSESTDVARAARLGVSTTALYRWTRGAGAPSEKAMGRLVYFSGMSEEDIREGRMPRESIA